VTAGLLPQSICKSGSQWDFYNNLCHKEGWIFMNFIISANTDIGTVKATNQDSLHVKTINTNQGRMVFAIMCDGMGGLAKGEVASASVVKSFMDWSVTSLPELCKAPLEDSVIRSQWEAIIARENEKIKGYGASQGVRMGTTVVVMLLTQTRYYILNVGDTRAYEISTDLKQITADQTFIAREVALGHTALPKPQVAEEHHPGGAV
jgi:serine/threonine protein phosphatase PrpC